MKKNRSNRHTLLMGYKLEIIGGSILLLISLLLPQFNISKDVVWFFRISSVLTTLAVAILKTYINITMYEMSSRWHESHGKAGHLHSILAGLNGLRFDHASKVMDTAISDIEQIEKGLIHLDPNKYYYSIIREISIASSNTTVYAIDCFDILRCITDTRQVNYLNENIRAAKRGVKIHRIYIVDDDLFVGPNKQMAVSILSRQLPEDNISLGLVWISSLKDHCSRIKDWVLFTDGEMRLYIDYTDTKDKSRVLQADLILDNPSINSYLEDFQIIKGFSLSEDEISTLINRVANESVITSGRCKRANSISPLRNIAKIGNDTIAKDNCANIPYTKEEFVNIYDVHLSKAEPYLSMRRYCLRKPVTTCEEAALAKSIPLKNELKTLILSTGIGFVAVEIPGNTYAKFQLIKTAIAVDEIRLANEAELNYLGLKPGTVCAVKNPVWSMTHLIGRSLLSLNSVSTNDGTQTGYLKFKPSVLLSAKYCLIGEFEADTQ